MKRNELILIDKKTFWVFIFQILKILNGLIGVLFVPIFLTSKEQGLWFLMLSFGSLILLFNASQNSIALIFGSHEFKSFKFKNFTIIGDNEKLENLFSFIKFTNKFYIKILTILSIFVLIIFYFYLDEPNSLEILSIFSIYIFGLYLYGLNFSILSYLESFNCVEYAYKFKSILVFFIVLITILLLYFDFRLYSLSISIFIVMFFWFGYFIYKFKIDLFKIFKVKNKFNRHKKKVFLNFFKKNSFSMVSGFLLFQVYTPIVYYFYGSKFAGKVGLSIAIMIALFAVSTSVLQSRLPYITKLISNKEYKVAYNIFFNILKLSVLIFIIFLSIGSFLLYDVDFFIMYKERVVEFKSFMILSLSWFLQLIVYFLVTFTRLFKRELFVVQTILSSIYIFISTIIILKFMSFNFIFFGLLTSYFFGLPWIYIVFKNFIKGKI